MWCPSDRKSEETIRKTFLGSLTSHRLLQYRRSRLIDPSKNRFRQCFRSISMSQRGTGKNILKHIRRANEHILGRQQGDQCGYDGGKIAERRCQSAELHSQFLPYSPLKPHATHAWRHRKAALRSVGADAGFETVFEKLCMNSGAASVSA